MKGYRVFQSCTPPDRRPKEFPLLRKKLRVRNAATKKGLVCSSSLLPGIWARCQSRGEEEDWALPDGPNKEAAADAQREVKTPDEESSCALKHGHV